MEFIKSYTFAIFLNILGICAVFIGSVIGLAIWLFVPPIAHIFTDDGIIYTTKLVGKIKYPSVKN